MRTSLPGLLLLLPLGFAASARAQTAEFAPPPAPTVSAFAPAPSAQPPPANPPAAQQPFAPPPPAPAVALPVLPPSYTPTPPAPTLSEPAWRIRDARVILNAKNVASLGLNWYRAKLHGSSSTSKETSYSLDFLTGARPSIDILLGKRSLWTVGAEANFWGYGQSSSSGRGVWFLPRGGVILGDAENFGVWLRAGIGYEASSSVSDRSTAGNSSSSGSAVLFLVDPVIIFSPAPHAAFTFGPDLFADSATSKADGVETGTSSRVSLGIQGGISLLL